MKTSILTAKAPIIVNPTYYIEVRGVLTYIFVALGRRLLTSIGEPVVVGEEHGSSEERLEKHHVGIPHGSKLHHHEELE